ncbi:hypothetical protein MKZ38_002720 [Zalerion maritima]|uniref:O-methyltransferase C-terminal domain-containing protein n=1 Tax=Zalerion maritima TaxID=339359 RepID=A0AAD5RES0_9PEZI|nr:hypothetical protein MKZ38_002720 [Zalerion maritima]
MHSVMHDWPNDVCLSILGRLKDAMKPGYSKILINDNVIPKTRAYWEISGFDITMMAIFSSMERTEEEWVELLEARAGLRIVKIWGGGRGVESLIECELPVESA